MTGRGRVVRWSAGRATILPWRGDSRVAYLATAPGGAPPTTTVLRRCLARVADDRYRTVLTPALAPGEEWAYRAVGFQEHERLHLLARDLERLPAVDTDHAHISLHRARRARHRQVLALDALAFRPFWRLDGRGLADALHATPHVLFRVALPAGMADSNGTAPLAYGICGISGSQGYLQRLAVHPDHQGQGIGTSMALDGLWWMRRRGVRRAVVNTQLDNGRALSLYERLGFRIEPAGLVVMRYDVVQNGP